jgi:aspartate aminotransferase
VEQPFGLDQATSLDAPDAVSRDRRRIADNRSHIRLRRAAAALLAEKPGKNAIPVGSPDEVLVTNGGIHGLFILFQALLNPGDEVIIPDPQWPPAASLVLAARGRVVSCPLHERLGWRLDVDELAERITPKTRVIYLNSPQNPTGGVSREDLGDCGAAHEAAVVVSDEAYEDVVFGGEHVSIASLAGMFQTVPCSPSANHAR